ncbi:MAG: hypothetical protein NT069_03940 [Planctomycetota bacterium]|nr:hypothetical protein [Planctomycetota bacterium]
MGTAPHWRDLSNTIQGKPQLSPSENLGVCLKLFNVPIASILPTELSKFPGDMTIAILGDACAVDGAVLMVRFANPEEAVASRDRFAGSLNGQASQSPPDEVDQSLPRSVQKKETSTWLTQYTFPWRSVNVREEYLIVATSPTTLGEVLKRWKDRAGETLFSCPEFSSTMKSVRSGLMNRSGEVEWWIRLGDFRKMADDLDENENGTPESAMKLRLGNATAITVSALAMLHMELPSDASHLTGLHLDDAAIEAGAVTLKDDRFDVLGQISIRFDGENAADGAAPLVELPDIESDRTAAEPVLAPAVLKLVPNSAIQQRWKIESRKSLVELLLRYKSKSDRKRGERWIAKHSNVLDEWVKSSPPELAFTEQVDDSVRVTLFRLRSANAE